MKNLLTYNEFTKVFEDLNGGVNSDSEVRKREIQEQVKEFNSKKGSMESIFARDIKRWEEEAAKLIGSNPYLAIWWRIRKIEHEIATAKKTPAPTDVRDAKRSQEKMQEMTRDLNDLKKEMTEKQQNDMKLLRL